MPASPFARPLGFRLNGAPIWPIMGASEDGSAQTSDDQGDTPKVNENGYPDNTPVAEMTDGQQAKYWQTQARKHEDRAKARGDYESIKAERDRLKTAAQTEGEKAVEDARSEGKAAARREFGEQAVAIHINAMTAVGRLSEEAAETLLDSLDKSKYLTDDGSLDTDKLARLINVVAPATGNPPPGRDPHQGNRQQGAGNHKPGSVSEVMAARRAAREKQH